MNKFDRYEEIKCLLQSFGCKVYEYKEINFGLQFHFELDNQKYIIRIYESKKGIKTDLSQIRDENVLKYINNLINSQSDFLDSKTDEKKAEYSSKYSEEYIEGLIGTDESGKGDYFGPLVIAGVYADRLTAMDLKAIGAVDSKKLSDSQISKLSAKIKKLCPYSIVAIGNEKYNELYYKFNNLNKLLAWGHGRVIENLLNTVDCKHVLADQFGDSSLIENALLEKGRKVDLKQRPRAEENVVVAAASIIARDEFVKRLKNLEDSYEMSFPKGASSLTIDAGSKFMEKYGKENLKYVAKLHFKTTNQL